MQRQQVAVGLQAELVDQYLPGPAEHLQRLRLPSGLGQRLHQQPVEALTQGVLGRQRGQFGHAARTAAEHHVQSDPLLQQGQSELREPMPLQLGERTRNTGQRLPLPQVVGPTEQVARLLPPPLGLGAVGQHRQLLRLQHVDGPAGQDQPVAALVRDQHLRRLHPGLQLPTQPPHIRPHRGPCLGRGVLRPEHVDQALGADPVPRLQQERCEHRLLLRTPQPERRSAEFPAHPPQQPEPRLTHSPYPRQPVGLQAQPMSWSRTLRRSCGGPVVDGAAGCGGPSSPDLKSRTLGSRAKEPSEGRMVPDPGGGDDQSQNDIYPAVSLLRGGCASCVDSRFTRRARTECVKAASPGTQAC